jgi:hypothetical protein
MDLGRVVAHMLELPAATRHVVAEAWHIMVVGRGGDARKGGGVELLWRMRHGVVRFG